MEQKYATTKAVIERYDLKSSRTLLRWQATRGFPKPAITGSGSTNRYLIADLDAWDDNQNTPTIDSISENQAA